MDGEGTDMSTKGIVAGLDIGATQIVVVIALPRGDSVEIIGVGSVPSQGLRRGAVVSIENTIRAIKSAKKEAELMAGVRLDSVYIGVLGNSVSSFDSRGMVALKDHEVSTRDVQRVVDAAKAVTVPANCEILHILPRDFRVDNQEGITDPVGMSGVRLESNVHIVTVERAGLQNIVKCTKRAGLEVSGLVLNSLASAYATLQEDEKHLGVALVDIGGSTTDIIVYVQGSVAYTSMLPFGGNHITNDVAVGMRTPPSCAEEIKESHGCALVKLADDSEMLEIPGVGGRPLRAVPRKHLAQVIEPRVEEILSYIHNDLLKSGMMGLIGSGVVLTGGSSQLEGLIEMGEFIFDMPVRKGVPINFSGLTDFVCLPEYATSIGLVLYGKEVSRIKSKRLLKVPGAPRFLGRIKDLIDSAF